MHKKKSILLHENQIDKKNGTRNHEKTEIVTVTGRGGEGGG